MPQTKLINNNYKTLPVEYSGAVDQAAIRLRRCSNRAFVPLARIAGLGILKALPLNCRVLKNRNIVGVKNLSREIADSNAQLLVTFIVGQGHLKVKVTISYVTKISLYFQTTPLQCLKHKYNDDLFAFKPHAPALHGKFASVNIRVNIA